MWALAIDFGTSRSTGAMYADGAITPLEVEGSRWMPSLVLLDPSGHVLVGTAADNQAGVYPDRVERTPKRHLGSPAPLVLGEGTLDAVDAAAAVIRVFLDEGRLRRNGEVPTEVVVTHPVRWADERKRALVEAVMRAGLPEPTLVEEPVAAAVHYVSDHVAVGQHVAIYDLGGGTFDTAVLRRTDSGFETIGLPGGDEFIGGEDFDHRLFRYFGECLAADDAQLWEDLCTSDERKFRRAALDLIVQARRAKEALSAWTSTQVFVPIADRDIVVNRSQFEAMIIDDVERTVDLMDDTIASADIASKDLAALYLVGGSSRIPLVVQLLTDRFGDRVTTRDEPKSVVALGAAKIAGALLAERDAPAPSVPSAVAEAPSVPSVLPHDAGVVATPPVTTPVPVAAAPMRTVTPGETLARVAPGLRRWSDRIGERAKAVIQALSSAPSAGAPATSVTSVPILSATTEDLRMAAVRWRLQFARLTGQLATDGHAVLFGIDTGEFRAVDAVTGTSLWIAQIGTPVTHEPTIHGSVVFAGGGDGSVRAFDIASGRTYWTIGLGSTITAPIVASGEYLMVVIGGGSVVGLDRSTGAGRWRLDTGGLPCAAALVSASTALAATEAGRVVHLDLAHGTTIWHTQLRGRVSGAPAIAHNLALVPAADGMLHALDIATGGERWAVATGGPLVGPVAVDGVHAYVASADGCVYAIDVVSGAAQWRHPAAGPYSSGPVVAAGALHVDTGNGELHVLDLTNHATRWRVGTGPYNRCRPARAGAMVVIGTPHAQLYGLYDQL